MYSNNNDVPLNKPLYNATMGQAVRRFFKKYFNFKGYASRSEYWWVVLFLFLIMLLPSGLSEIGKGSNSAGLQLIGVIFSLIYLVMLLVILIPSLSITWRRLHDAGFSGAWFFLTFIPIFGGIILLIMTILPTNTAKHRREWDDNTI